MNIGDGLLNRLFVIFGGLLVLVLIAALVAPGFIDWRDYRTEFEKQAARVLGQKVEVLGEVKARLLPLPRIVFTDVRVGARDDGKAMMVVDRFRVDVELAPLLKGDINIVDMELQNPRVNIDIGENGVVDWTNRKTAGVNPDDVLLEKVTIFNGSVRLYNIATNQSFEAEQINASISARTLAGPWQVRGDLVLNGEKADIKINTGRLQEKGIINTRLNIQPYGHPYSVELNGPIGMADGALSYSGGFKLRAAISKKNTNNSAPERQFPYPALPARITGRFAVRPDALKVSEFTLTVGDKDDPYSITGTAQAAFGDRSVFRIVAEGQQIDVDRLGKLSKSGGKIPSLGERLQVLKTIAEKIPVPSAEGLISLYLPAIIAGDTVVREVGVDISPSSNGWQLSNFEAGLPGRTSLRAHGLLTLGDNFGFTGQFLLASKQPSGFAGWLKGDVDEAIRRLPNAGFSALAVLSEKRVLLENLEIVLGATNLKGALERVANRNGKPTLTANLAGNSIDYETLRALFLLFVSDRDGARFFDHNLDIKLASKRFSAFGTVASSVATSLKYTNDRLMIEKLEIGSLAGAKISAKGEISDPLNLPKGEINISIDADKSAGLLKLLRNSVGNSWFLENLLDDPSLVDNLNLAVSVKAVAEQGTSKLQLDLVGEAGGTGIDLNLNVEGSVNALAKAKSRVKLVLVNPEPQILLRQMAIPVLPLDVDGPLQLSAKLQGRWQDNLDAEFEFSMGNARFSGEGEIDYTSEGAIRNRLNVVLNVPDLGPMMLLSGISFPGLGGAINADLSANFSSTGSAMSLNNIAGVLAGQSVSASLMLDREAKPRPRIDGNLSLGQLSLKYIAGLVMGETAIEDGISWSTSVFTPPTLAGLDGTIQLNARSVDFPTAGFGYQQPGKNLTASLELGDGDIALRDAQIDWLGGVVTGDLALSRNQKEVVANARFTVVDGNLGDLSPNLQNAPLIDGIFTLNTSVEGSGANIAEIVKNLVGGGTLSVQNGIIRQLNPKSLIAILEQADRQPDESLESVAASLADGVLSENDFEFDTGETAFTIAGGNLRIDNMVVATKDARLSSDLRVDLKNLSISGSSQLIFEAREEALTGATPEIELVFDGPLAKPEFRWNTNLLASFLTMRAQEKKERAYQAQKEEILENQRLTRMVRLYKKRVKIRQRATVERDLGDNLEQQIQLKELESAGEKARQARVEIENRQREAEKKRRQDEALTLKLRRGEESKLARQKASLKRRQEAFQKLLQEQTEDDKNGIQTDAATISENQSSGPGNVPALAPPQIVHPVGSPRKKSSNSDENLPGVFGNLEDRIGEILKRSR